MRVLDTRKEKKMKTAKFQYKCRLCGEIEENPCTGEKNALIDLIEVEIHGRVKTMGIPLEILGIHNCSDGNVGISDLIGYKLY